MNLQDWLGITNPIITLLVGGFAIGLYIKQRNDAKKDAANIILLEIKNAERKLKLAKESIINDQLSSDIFTMENENWSKYSYLFVRDFDRDEWDTITDFYNRCKQYDQSVIYNNSFFQKNEEQIRINLQRIRSDYAKYSSEQIETGGDEEAYIEEFNSKFARFESIYMKSPNLYYPQKPFNDAKKLIDNLNLGISISSIGQKLKKIAKIKD